MSNPRRSCHFCVPFPPLKPAFGIFSCYTGEYQGRVCDPRTCQFLLLQHWWDQPLRDRDERVVRKGVQVNGCNWST
ncbi:hypothetical protein SLEP1_g30149 [Rubroshorea leprosula]|uniref:Uncharacterized protein n=1 Tax=Rubroshorea leprosula TaxID=152421 RepID=A0AAV5JZ63_9ROSI|nr:hypothetical protein SLEP1_g30149 [Rubroshorea leprosula]